MAERGGGALSHVRVLDLSDEKGHLCGKVLADLGADVIKVEPPGGDPVRRRAPFLQDGQDAETSVLWLAYNTSKKGVTLDLEKPEGRTIFRSLVRKVAIVVESYPPGYMASLGLGYGALRNENAGIIVTSITAFGQSGPFRDHKVTDIVAMAMGGAMSACGVPDRPPLRVSVEQAYPMAGAQAAMGALLALRHRTLTGEGQHVDVSIQESVMRTITFDIGQYEGEGYIGTRLGVRRRRGITYSRDLWPCQDGHIGWRLMGGRMGAPTMRALVEWMDSEGMAGELKGIKWETVDMAKLTQEELERWEDTICAFFLKHTKADIYDMALKKRMLMCPGYNVKELLDYQQLAERDFWVPVEYPDLGKPVMHPGAFCRMMESPLTPPRRAPRLGEHNEEIYVNELGFSTRELARLKERGIV